MQQLPNTKLLQAFESSARHLSFTLAGKELFLSQSAVSRQVQTLENDLGITLFRRKGKSLEMTEEGIQLFESLKINLTAIADSITRIKGGETARIHTKVPASFASRWLAPRLHRFHNTHGVAVSVHIDGNNRNLSRAPCECEVAFGHTLYAELGASLLFREWVQPACPQEVLAIILSRGIDAVPLLHTLANFSPLPYWEHWVSLNPESRFCPSQESLLTGIEFSTQEQAINAAIYGLGVTMVDIHIASMVLKKKLLIPLGEPVMTPFGYWLFPTAQSSLPDSQAVKFHHWLQEEAGFCSIPQDFF